MLYKILKCLCPCIGVCYLKGTCVLGLGDWVTWGLGEGLATCVVSPRLLVSPLLYLYRSFLDFILEDNSYLFIRRINPLTFSQSQQINKCVTSVANQHTTKKKGLA